MNLLLLLPCDPVANLVVEAASEAVLAVAASLDSKRLLIQVQ